MRIKILVLFMIGFMSAFTPPFSEASIGKPRKSAAPAFPENYPAEGIAVPFTRNGFFTFLWSEKMMEYAPFYFILVPLYEYQTPEQAIKENDIIYKTDNIKTYYLNYPWDAPDLKGGKFAWQIGSDKGELFTSFFWIDQQAKIIFQIYRYYNQYAYLKEKLDGSYHIAFDSRLWLHYKEPYQGSKAVRLKFRVFDSYGYKVAETDETGSVIGYPVPVVPIQTGDNWIQINLESTGISLDNYYTIEVWDEKGGKYYQRFKVASSYPYIQLK
ncbi:MAG: hypothetical protein RR356_01270 [Bacteroidales bacterium]